MTSAVAESKRIATDKVDALLQHLDDLRRAEPRERDGRTFP
jgi:hypothetical protein